MKTALRQLFYLHFARQGTQCDKSVMRTDPIKGYGVHSRAADKDVSGQFRNTGNPAVFGYWHAVEAGPIMLYIIGIIEPVILVVGCKEGGDVIANGKGHGSCGL